MKLQIFILFIFCFISLNVVHASGELFLDAPESFKVGEKIPVTLFLETSGVSINSIDITLTLSNPDLRLVGYQDYTSVVKFWIDPPKQVGNTVTFVGGIPGGISTMIQGVSTTTRIPLVVLLFESERALESSITIDKSIVLQNDGRGSTFQHERKGVNILGIQNFFGVKEDQEEYKNTKTDITPPVFDQITLIPSSFFSKNPTLITFSASDEESGIAGFHAMIHGNKRLYIQSPLVVQKKFFPYTVFIEAYDIYGNKQTASVIVPGVLLGDRFVWLLLGITLGGAFLYIIKKQYVKK